MKICAPRIVVNLTRAQTLFLNQEVQRLRLEYGLNVHPHDIVRCLIELHMQKMTLMASENPDAVMWCYRRLAEKVDD